MVQFNLATASVRSEADLERLYLLTREGFTKSALAEYRDRKEATSRYMLAAIILNSESVQSAMRREIRRVSEILVDPESVDKMLREEVIKRETIEGPEAEAAQRRVQRSADKRIGKASDRPEASDAIGATAAPDPASAASAERA